MPSVIRAAEFFVVGGPVGPERACYVVRAADARLAKAVRAGRLAFVLGPPASGKTSLLERAAHVLAKTGARVARVDLGGLVPESDGADAALCRIAGSIARSLELDVDIAAWWAAHEPPLGESKLVEFFAAVVLGAVDAPVVVLVDELEAALGTPWQAELVDAIAASYARRERDARFARLTFVLAGAITMRALLGARSSSRWEGAELVEPADFSLEEAYGLADAFGGDAAQAQALMDRIWAWTGGQPYLTQKVARGVARKGGGLMDVERVVREQVLAAEPEADAVLGPLRERLGARTRRARRATRLLAKLGGGGRSGPPRDAGVAETLWLSGAARTVDGRLTIRNRVVRELVVTRWVEPARSGRRVAIAAIALGVAIAAGGYWYTRYFPESDIEALTSADATLAAAEAAYERLHDLPGFTERADELWLAALERQGRSAATLAAALAVDTRLRALGGADARADALLGDFWLRRANAAMQAEDREAAVLLAQRAARLAGEGSRAVATLAELVGDDLPRLDGTLRLETAPAEWRLAFGEALLVTLDTEHRLARVPFGAPGAAAALVQLTALQPVALVRELDIEGEGTAGDFVLTLTVTHPATGELSATLRAPSGAEAALALPASETGAAETFEFEAAAGGPLATLADEGRGGTWTLTLVDRVGGNAGSLLRFGLGFGDDSTLDEPLEPVAIPDPMRVADVELTRAGARALAWPRGAADVGSVSQWNLLTGALEHDVALPAPPRDVALNATNTRALAATAGVLVLWDVASGTTVARLATQTEFVLPPVFSSDGAYVAIAERVDGANPLLSVLRSADGSLVSSSEGVADAVGWELGPSARYFALRMAANAVVVADGRNGRELRRIASEWPFERVIHRPDGRAVLTVDARGAIATWPLDDVREPARPLGRTAAADTVSLSTDGLRLAFARTDGAIEVIDARTAEPIAVLRQPRAVPATRTALAPDGSALVTQSGALLRTWTLPPRAMEPVGRVLEAPVTALAFDPAGEWLGVGFASGQARFGPADALQAPSLASFGHRGAVTALAVRAGLGVAVTGGRDGFVRFWDVATGEPTGVVVQSAALPISAVALSEDGRYAASGAAGVVRVADLGGVVRFEWPVRGAVTALAFAPGGAQLVVATDAGDVAIASLTPGSEPQTVELEAPARAVAFVAAGLVIGDAAGRVRFFSLPDGTVRGEPLRLPGAPRWLASADSGATLLAATDAWLHARAAEPPFAPRASRLVAVPAVFAAFALEATGSVAAAGVDAAGALVVTHEPAASDVAPPPATAAGLVERDWSAALKLGLDAEGAPRPLDP